MRGYRLIRRAALLGVAIAASSRPSPDRWFHSPRGAAPREPRSRPAGARGGFGATGARAIVPTAYNPTSRSRVLW